MHLFQTYVSAKIINNVLVKLQPALKVSEEAKKAYPYDVPAPDNYIAGGARNFIRKAQSGQCTLLAPLLSCMFLHFMHSICNVMLNACNNREGWPSWQYTTCKI